MQALEDLRNIPFEDLGFAKVDHHRAIRHGMPEVIFGKGKTPDQVAGIAQALLAKSSKLLLTRATAEMAERVKAVGPGDGVFSGVRRGARVAGPDDHGKGKIAAVCAGTSDLPWSRKRG